MITDIHKVVLFDHDDTLVGTIGSKWKEHIYIAKKYYGKDLTEAEIRQHWGVPFNQLIGILYGTEDIETAVKYNVRHHTEFEKELFVATVPTLKRIKESGRLVGVITATSKLSFEHDLKHHGVPSEFLDYTQTQEATDYHKPDSRVFEPVKYWLKTVNVKPEEVIYIGDGLRDMEAALGAGFDFLGVETGLVSAKEFRANGAKSVSSIADVFQV